MTNIKILNFNCNGFRSSLKYNNIVNNIEKKNNTIISYLLKYDIICLQEIKLNKDSINLLSVSFPNYFIYYNIPHTKKGYSGVAILSKIKAIKHSTNFYNDDEGRYLELEFNKLYLVNIYKPNAGAKLERLQFKNRFDNLFLQKINRLKQKKEVLICGDMNAIQFETDTYNFKSQNNRVSGVTDIEIENLNKLINNKNIFNLFREIYPKKLQFSFFSFKFPSRTYNKGMLLDYVLITKDIKKYVKNIKYLDNIYSSDHLPIKVVLDSNLFR
jgi:exodeoxyribonuclease-3